MIPAPFTHLAQLVGSYLNEDWDREHGTLDEAIAAFKAETSPEEHRAVVTELRRALSLAPSDELGPLLDALGADVNPEPWGGSRGLLCAIRRALDSP